MNDLFDFNTQNKSERINGAAYSMEVKTMDAQQVLKNILSNGAVWGAVILLINLILTTYFPEIPQNILNAAQLLAVTILGAAGVSMAAYRVGYVKAAQDFEARSQNVG